MLELPCPKQARGRGAKCRSLIRLHLRPDTRLARFLAPKIGAIASVIELTVAAENPVQVKGRATLLRSPALAHFKGA